MFGEREACPALVNGSIPARRPGGSVAEGRYLADEETIHYGIILDLARQCDEYRSMADARYLARIFRVLSNPNRLRIYAEILKNEETKLDVGSGASSPTSCAPSARSRSARRRSRIT